MNRCALVTDGSGFLGSFVVRDLLNPQATGKTFHAVVPIDAQPTAAEMIATVRDWARCNLGFDPGAPRFVSAPALARFGRQRNLAASDTPKRKSSVQNMLALAPYFCENRTYDTTNTQTLMGGEYPDWHDYLPRLLAYAVRVGFLNHTGRTVFQQMLVRLSAKHNTISYYDVTSDGMRRTDADEAKNAILKVAGALRSRGIGVGVEVEEQWGKGKLISEIFEAIDVSREKTFFGTLNAGHPGGCFSLTEAEAETLHHSVLPDNLFIADSSLFPRSMGNPPILTIMALAMKVARASCEVLG